jgi:hypothetical protein
MERMSLQKISTIKDTGGLNTVRYKYMKHWGTVYAIFGHAGYIFVVTSKIIIDSPLES